MTLDLNEMDYGNFKRITILVYKIVIQLINNSNPNVKWCVVLLLQELEI